MDEFVGTLILGLGVLVLGLVIGSVSARHEIQGVAATYECAQYNPQSGDFEWLDTK